MTDTNKVYATLFGLNLVIFFMIVLVSWTWLFAAVPFIAWFLYCNHETRRQRLEILDSIRDISSWRTALSHFDSVGYDTHLWYLITFRNPRPLYNEQLRSFF